VPPAKPIAASRKPPVAAVPKQVTVPLRKVPTGEKSAAVEENSALAAPEDTKEKDKRGSKGLLGMFGRKKDKGEKFENASPEKKPAPPSNTAKPAVALSPGLEEESTADGGTADLQSEVQAVAIEAEESKETEEAAAEEEEEAPKPRAPPPARKPPVGGVRMPMLPNAGVSWPCPMRLARPALSGGCYGHAAWRDPPVPLCLAGAMAKSKAFTEKKAAADLSVIAGYLFAILLLDCSILFNSCGFLALPPTGRKRPIWLRKGPRRPRGNRKNERRRKPRLLRLPRHRPRRKGHRARRKKRGETAK